MASLVPIATKKKKKIQNEKQKKMLDIHMPWLFLPH